METTAPKFDSFTVVVICNDDGRAVTTSSWEADVTINTLEQQAAMAAARLIAQHGSGDVTIAVHYHNA